MTGWNEADHPRWPPGSEVGGRFRHKNATDAARMAAGLVSNSEQRIMAYKEFHDWMLEQAEEEGLGYPSVEKAALVNDQGMIVQDNFGVGDEYTISFGEGEVASMYGGHIVHSHPDSLSFSVPDVEFGLKHALSGMVVVEEKGLHILEFPDPDLISARDTYGVVDRMKDIRWELLEGWSTQQIRSGARYANDPDDLRRRFPDIAYRHTIQAMQILDQEFEEIDFTYISWEDY